MAGKVDKTSLMKRLALSLLGIVVVSCAGCSLLPENSNHDNIQKLKLFSVSSQELEQGTISDADLHAEVIMMILEDNFDAAIKSVGKMSKSSRDSVLVEIVDSIVIKDARKALKIAEEIQTEEDRNRAFESLALYYSDKDTMKALDMAVKISKSDVYCEVFGDILEGTKARNTDKIIKYVSKFADSRQKDECLMILGRDCKDPEKILQITRQIFDEAFKWELLKDRAAYLASINKDGAMELINQLPELYRNETLSWMICAVCTNHPETVEKIIEEFSLDQEKDKARQLLVSAISQQKPEMAEQITSQMFAGDYKDMAYEYLIDAYSHSNVDKAVSILDDLSNEKIKKKKLREIVETSVDVNPDKASELVDRINNVRVRDEILNKLAMKYIDKDFPKAMQMIGKISNEEAHDRILKGLALEYTGKDNEKAFALATNIVSVESMNYALVDVIASYAGKDFEKAMQMANNMEMDSLKNLALGRIAAAVVVNNPNKAEAIIGQFKEDEWRIEGIQNICSTLMDTYPDKAFKYAELLPEGATRDHEKCEIAKAVCTALISKNPDEALKYAERIPNGEVRDQKLSEIADVIAKVDTDKALQIAGKIGESSSRDEAITRIAIVLADKDLDKARQIAKQMKNDKNREKILSKVIDCLIEKDTDLAFQLIDEFQLFGHTDKALAHSAVRWASNDLARSIYTVYEISSADLRNKTLGMIAEMYAGKDPEKAIKLYNLIQDENNRDMIQFDIMEVGEQQTIYNSSIKRDSLRRIFRIISAEDVDNAIKYVKKLKYNGDRRNAIAAIAETWMKNDPEAAKKWIDGLPERDQVNKRMEENKKSATEPK